MIEALVAAVIFLIGAIFTAGRIIAGAMKELGQTKLDVNRIGTKIRDEEKAAARRHHNLCMVIVAGEQDQDRRMKIAQLLKEN